MKTKYAKLVVKDGAGEIVQLLPETKVDDTLDVNSNLPISNSAVATRFAALGNSKEVGILSSEPSASNTSELKNESVVFWDQGTSTPSSDPKTPVFTTGNQTVLGVKKFAVGVFGGVKTLSSTETALDCSQATCFIKTVTANTSFTFTNVPEDAACCVTLILKNGGNYTVRWPSGVKWTENTAPILTSNGTDVLTFITGTGGNVWYGTTTCIGVTV